MKKIEAFVIIHLLVVIAASLAQVTVSWDVNKTQEFKNGDTMELICTVTGTTCCSSLRSWNGGPSFSSLMNNGAPSNAAKYKEVINTNSFSLLIYNMDRSDFLDDYRCSYGFDNSPRSKLTPPANARYVPAASEIQELSSSTVDEKLNFEVNVTTVFPAPSCTAEFGGADISSSMTLTTTDDFPFKFAVLSMSNIAYTCPGSLDVSCSVGSYSFNVLTLDPCTGGGGGGSSDGGLIAGIIVIVIIPIIIIIICCLFNKRCRSRCLRKDSKLLFTWPRKDIVVIDIHPDKDLTIVRPTGEKIEIQCLRTEIGSYLFDGKVLSDGNGVRVMNNPCLLFNPFFEICCLEMEHEGSYIYKQDNSSENSCILTMEMCKDIIISSKPRVYWAHEGEWLKLQLVETSYVERWIKESSVNGKKTIIQNPQKKGSLVLQNINNEDEGSYIAANRSETRKSGCLTLKIVKSLVTVGKKDGSYVTTVENSIKLKFIECKSSSIKHLKWKKYLSTDETEIRELESTLNYELILSEVTKKDEGRYWCEVINKYGTSTKSGILTLHVVHDIVNVGLRPTSFSANIGDSIQIRYTYEMIPQQIIFRAIRSGTNQIAPEPKVTKITDTASLLIEEISKEDEGCYQFASANGDAMSGVLTLSVMEGNESETIVYLGQSESGGSTFRPRNGAKTFLDAIPKKEDTQEIPDKKKKKKMKKIKKEKEGEAGETIETN